VIAQVTADRQAQQTVSATSESAAARDEINRRHRSFARN
jgi:hypothetical protein